MLVLLLYNMDIYTCEHDKKKKIKQFQKPKCKIRLSNNYITIPKYIFNTFSQTQHGIVNTT